jgi:excinuclease ABC subunit C
LSAENNNPDDLPEKPGIYIFKDSEDRIIYVGKAKSLKNRVKSYFKDDLEDPKTRALMRQFHHLEYLVTDTEKEALILESNMIKKHLPRYNIRLKDDKRYPYIQITRENYPRILITRKILEDGTYYYGPFTDVRAVRSMLKRLKPLFRLRDCKRMDGPCLNYQIELCDAPCAGNIAKDEYQKGVEKVQLFLEGRQTEVIALLKKEMVQASSNHEYEKAAIIRDQLLSLEHVMQKQKMEFNRSLDQDVVAYSSDGDIVVAVVFRVREGKILGKEDFMVEGAQNNLPSELLSAFIKQYYSGPRQVPQEILLPLKVEDAELIIDWLSDKRAAEVLLKVPIEGLEHHLVQMVTKNAEIILKHQKQEMDALLALKDYLKIPRIPRRIEAFDISNLSGEMAVASMVVFEDGKPQKNSYRRYKIKTPGPDDYAMMREVLMRRYQKLVHEEEKLPDLVVVDGGRGQLNVALDVLDFLNLKISVVGLAKEYEQIFLPQVSIPIILPPNSPSLHLLQMVRDEAHRFAVNYHKNIRSRDLESSILDYISGVGPKRKANLLRHFGDLESIKKATVNQIGEVRGINRSLALEIHRILHQEGV